jgi:GH43 family beta-xylosidase
MIFLTQKMKHLRIFFTLVLALAAHAGVSLAADDAARWTNPLVKQRADPAVYLHSDGYYYFTASVPAYDLVELRRAKTLAGLTDAPPKMIWHKHSTGVMGAHIWAPEIHFINNKWYIYFAAGGAEKIWDIRIYALENASANPLEGVWREAGQIKTDWESFALDSTTFEVKGTRYFAWAQSNPKIKANTCLYIAKMNGPLAISGPQIMISQPDLPWEQVGFRVNEAPAALISHGRVFLTYSASATGASYCMGMLSAAENADLLDPKSWTKSPTPIMVSNDGNSQYGPGHNCFTTSPDGKTDIIVYHARNYRDIKGDPLYDPNRNTRAQVVRWNPDGTPDFGVPVADGGYVAGP